MMIGTRGHIGGFMRALLLLASNAAVQQAVAVSPTLPDRIEYVSGGLMSPHVELLIDLESGVYTLVEPAPGALLPVETQKGQLSTDHLFTRRIGTQIIEEGGFKTLACQRAEHREALRRKRLAARGQIIMDHLSMDAQLSFWVRIAGRAEAAPRTETCWTHEGKNLQQDMFAAARADLRLSTAASGSSEQKAD